MRGLFVVIPQPRYPDLESWPNNLSAVPGGHKTRPGSSDQSIAQSQRFRGDEPSDNDVATNYADKRDDNWYVLPLILPIYRAITVVSHGNRIDLRRRQRVIGLQAEIVNGANVGSRSEHWRGRLLWVTWYCVLKRAN